MNRSRRRSLPIPSIKDRACTLLASFAAATGVPYDDLMGASGAAFTTTIDPASWDPLAAAPLDAGTLERAARAAGMRVDRVTPPFDDEMRELVFERVVEAVDASLPPLIRGAVGPAEFGAIIGYDEAGPMFLVRTYFDRGPEPSRIGWDAFVGEGHGEPYFLDRGTAPERPALARTAIDAAAASASASDDALRTWLAGLRDEDRWKDARHSGQGAFADHAMRAILHDTGRSGARGLGSVGVVLPRRAGAELLRAAEAYGRVADAAERIGVGAFDPGIAMRFVEGGHRRAWANALEGAIAHEAEAHEALRAAA